VVRHRAAPALLAFVALLMVTGCGFHLRGTIAIPAGLEPVYIQSGGPVGQAIEQRLQGSGVSVTSAASQAGLMLRILGQSRSARVVAVDRFGKALAYALELSVRFEAVDATGAQLITPQEITLERTFDDNPNVAVLGKQLETEIIYQDLIGDVADQVLLRLRAAIATRAG
jgi:LPS-assembly lipoprotein